MPPINVTTAQPSVKDAEPANARITLQFAVHKKKLAMLLQKPCQIIPQPSTTMMNFLLT